jgi:hypothetical protein
VKIPVSNHPIQENDWIGAYCPRVSKSIQGALILRWVGTEKELDVLPNG